MEKEKKDMLIKKLELSNYLLTNNEKVLDLAKELNEKNLENDQKQEISNLLSDYINNDIKDFTLIKKVIEILDIPNKSYILSIIDLRSINFLNNKENAINTIKLKLNEDIQFNNEFNKYSYYSLIVNLTIISKDVEFIKLAIDKIQSI